MSDPYLTDLVTGIDGLSDDTRFEVTVNEVNLTESLSTPGLQTSLILQSTTNTPKTVNSNKKADAPTKNLDEYLW